MIANIKYSIYKARINIYINIINIQSKKYVETKAIQINIPKIKAYTNV
jgi:hypothetical protein